MPRTRIPGPALLLCGAVLSLALSGPASAQEGPGGISVVTPPRGETGEAFRELTAPARIRTEAIYSDETDPAFFKEDAANIRPARQPREGPSIRLEGGSAVFIVVALVLVLIFLWLRYGGSGALLSSEPKQTDGETTAPEAWRIGADEANMDSRSLLDQIRAMPDRRAALVRLLRHALLAAGSDSQTRFARSDTEREAYARLPGSWQHRQLLGLLLRATELAHYGGREVSEDAFEQALEQGALILGRRGGAHA